MKIYNEDEVKRRLKDKELIYRCILVPPEALRKNKLMDFWEKYGLGICWSLYRKKSTRIYDFHPGEDEIGEWFCIVMCARAADHHVDWETMNDLYTKEHGEYEKEIRLKKEIQIFVESYEVAFVNKKFLKKFEVGQGFNTGPGWHVRNDVEISKVDAHLGDNPYPWIGKEPAEERLIERIVRGVRIILDREES